MLSNLQDVKIMLHLTHLYPYTLLGLITAYDSPIKKKVRIMGGGVSISRFVPVVHRVVYTVQLCSPAVSTG